MKKIFFILTSLAIALLIQWILGAWFSPWGVPLPIFAAVLFFWFWNLGLVPRLWLGIGAGVLLDILSLNRFGIYTAIFMALGLGVHALQFIFSDTRSSLVQGMGIGLLLALFLVLGFLLI